MLYFLFVLIKKLKYHRICVVETTLRAELLPLDREAPFYDHHD